MAFRKVLDARVAGKRLEAPRHPRVEPLTLKSALKEKPSTLHCVSADATLLEALKVMAEHDVGAVLVLDDGRAVGIFSEREYARSSILATQWRVSEVMTFFDLFADLNDSVQECLSLMIVNRMRYLPVQQENKPIALLSLDDLLREMVEYLERVFKENELDEQIVFLRGTYSC